MYNIEFYDNTTFKGGDFKDSLWNKIPGKPIKKLTYKVGKHEVILEGYDAYNHLLEKADFLGTRGYM